MQIATGGSMLNFGYWSTEHRDPISAQKNLCSVFGDLSELSTAKNAIDVGSGLSAPSKLWRDIYPNLKLYDVNINFKQLCFLKNEKNIQFLNSTSTKLPFMNNSVDRVLALESAQHFKPLDDFIVESKRVLTSSGLAIEISFLLVIFFNLLNEHFLSPATKVKIKQSSARNTKLFTIAPISHFREDAASLAVRAVSFKTIIFKSLSKSLSTFSALLTGSLSNKLIIQLTID